MQSYHAALLSVCDGCATLLAKSGTSARLAIALHLYSEGLDSAIRLCNSQRRKLRLRVPKITKSTCLDRLLEHACYLLRIQQGSTQQQETAWVTDSAVGQYLRHLGTCWVIPLTLAQMSDSRLVQSIQQSGVLQLLAAAADRVRDTAAAATPQTLQTSCTDMCIGMSICYTQLYDAVARFGQAPNSPAYPNKICASMPLGQLTLSLLRMYFKLMPLVSAPDAEQPTGNLKLMGKAFHDIICDTVGGLLWNAWEMRPIITELSAEHKWLSSDTAVLQALALTLAEQATELRKLLAFHKQAASSSTTAAVPSHHMALYRALQLEDAAPALRNADGVIVRHGVVVEERVSKYAKDMSSAAGMATSVYNAAINVFFDSPNITSRPTPITNARNPKQQSADNQPCNVQQSSTQQGSSRQQQQQALLELLPLLFGVMLELHLLAQQLLHQTEPAGGPLQAIYCEDCQRDLLYNMESLMHQLVSNILAQQQQQQLHRIALGQVCGHAETALRTRGKAGRTDLTVMIEDLGRVLVWLASSTSSSTTVSRSTISTIPAVAGLLVTCCKCWEAGLGSLKHKGYHVAVDSTVAGFIRQALSTASTGIQVAGAGLADTPKAAAAAAKGTLPEAAAAGLMLAGRSMHVAGAMIAGKQCGLPLHAAPGADPKYVGMLWDTSQLAEMLADLDTLLAQLPSAMEAAAAMRLQEQYQQLKQAVQARHTTSCGAVSLALAASRPDDTKVIAEQLMSFGGVLCAEVPVPFCCNNPGCMNLSCKSERKLVGGKGCVCAGCQQARYCGAECQKEHRKQHKPFCKRLR